MVNEADTCRKYVVPRLVEADCPSRQWRDNAASWLAYLDGLQAKVDQLEALQAKTAADLDALLPSILDKAFKGEP